MAAPKLEFRVSEFTGGRITKASSLQIPANASDADLNISHTVTGAIEKRGGSILLSPAAMGTGPIMGLYDWVESDGTKHIVAGSGDELWEMKGEIGSLKAQRIAGGFIPCQPWFFAPFNDWLYCSNYADPPYRWDGDKKFRLTGLTAVPAQAASKGTVTGVGSMAAGDYDYKFVATYGVLGKANASTKTSITGVGGSGAVVWADLTFPKDAEKLEIYRRKTTDPDIYYYVGETTTSTYTDTALQTELIDEYPGDRTKPLHAAFPRAHKNRMWYGHCSERDGSGYYPSRVEYSDFYQPDRIEGFHDVFPLDGDVITGIMPLHNNLVVFKRKAIYSILGTDYRDFQVIHTDATRGCIAPLSIAAMDDRIYFLSGDGVYFFDGARTHLVSNDIEPDILALSSSSKLWASAEVRQGIYYLSVKG